MAIRQVRTDNRRPGPAWERLCSCSSRRHSSLYAAVLLAKVFSQLLQGYYNWSGADMTQGTLPRHDHSDGKTWVLYERRKRQRLVVDSRSSYTAFPCQIPTKPSLPTCIPLCGLCISSMVVHPICATRVQYRRTNIQRQVAMIHVSLIRAVC